MEKYRQLQATFEEFESEATKFFTKGNKAAGTRARKSLQDLKAIAQELRLLIQHTRLETKRNADLQNLGSFAEES